MFEFESGTISLYFSFIFVLVGESCLLVSWCAGGRCGMACSDEDRGKSRRPGTEDRGWSHRSGHSVVGRLRGQVAPCAVCTWHTWRLGAQVSWLSLKTKVDGF
jgi:hypothetical protein